MLVIINCSIGYWIVMYLHLIALALREVTNNENRKHRSIDFDGREDSINGLK